MITIFKSVYAYVFPNYFLLLLYFFDLKYDTDLAEYQPISSNIDSEKYS